MGYRLTKRRGRKYWQVSFDNGETWRSTGCLTREEAEAKLSGREEITFGDYAKDFYSRRDESSYRHRKEIRGKSNTSGTLYQKELSLNAYILPRFKDRPINDIKCIEIDDWFTSLRSVRFNRRLGSSSANFVLSVLRDILDFAVREGVVDTNEAKKVELMKKRHRKRNPITLGELRILFPEDDNLLYSIWGSRENALFFLIFIDTGFRPCEILGLRYSDFKDGAVYTERIYDQHTKRIADRIKTVNNGMKYKVGVLSERTVRVLGNGSGSLFDISYFTVFHSNWIFKNVCRQYLKREDVTQYQLRKAFMTMRIGKYPKELIMELMGHTQWESCYDDRTPEQVMESVRTALTRYQA